MKVFSKTINIIMALGIYLALFFFVIHQIDETIDFTPILPYSKVLFVGWLRTILISFLSILGALVIGLVLYFLGESPFGVLRYMTGIHKTIVFGTPLIVLAIVSYFYIGNAFHIKSKIVVGVMTLALYIGAYVADIYKGAIESIHVNQWQTAKMFGFTKYQTYRYIIFPQVMKSILPPLAGQFALTVKGSALLSYMAMPEFLNEINFVKSTTFATVESFIIVAIGYWIITIPLILLIRHMERQMHVSF